METRSGEQLVFRLTFFFWRFSVTVVSYKPSDPIGRNPNNGTNQSENQSKYVPLTSAGKTFILRQPVPSAGNHLTCAKRGKTCQLATLCNAGLVRSLEKLKPTLSYLEKVWKMMFETGKCMAFCPSFLVHKICVNSAPNVVFPSGTVAEIVPQQFWLLQSVPVSVQCFLRLIRLAI